MSKIPNELIASDFVITKKSNYWIGTGLTVDSVVRLHKIVTIPKSLIKRKLGSSTELEKQIFDKVIQLFKE